MTDTSSPPPRTRPLSDDLITPDQRAALLANGRRTTAGADRPLSAYADVARDRGRITT